MTVQAVSDWTATAASHFANRTPNDPIWLQAELSRRGFIKDHKVKSVMALYKQRVKVNITPAEDLAWGGDLTAASSQSQSRLPLAPPLKTK